VTNPIRRYSAAQDRYVWSLESVFRDGSRIWDPSYALSKDPDAFGKARLDPVVDGSVERFCLNVVGRKWSCEAPTDDPVDVKAAEIMTELLGKIQRFSQSRMLLALASFHGSAFCDIRGQFKMEPIFDRKPRRWWVPLRLKDVDRDRFRGVAEEQDDGSYGIRWERRSVGAKVWQTVENPEWMVRHICTDSESTFGYGRGDMDSIYMYLHAKDQVLKMGLQGLRRWARGVLDISIDGARDSSTSRPNTAILQEWMDEADKMLSGDVIAHDSRDIISFLPPPAGTNDMSMRWLEYLDKWIVVRIEGSYLPSGGSTSGTDALGKIQQTTSSARAAHFRDAGDETLTADLVSLVWSLNFTTMSELDPALATANMPKFVTGEEKIEDPERNARVASTLLGAGVSLKRKEVIERAGYTVPGPDDEVIAPRPAPTPGAFPNPEAP